MNTITFNNESSLGHIIEWLAGIESMISHPLGIGLGESGRIAAFLGDNTGGENQFIIIGVQAGVIAFAIYIAIYVLLIKNAFQWFYKLRGKEKKICLAILLMKVGFIIPAMTANFESYIYISYVNWFLTGLFINIISSKQEKAVGNKIHLQ
jgi:O-antigen ligase